MDKADVPVNYSIKETTSTVSPSTVFNDLAIMSLQPPKPDRESDDDLDDSLSYSPKHVSETTCLQGNFLLNSFMNDQIKKEGLEIPVNDEIVKPLNEEEAHALGRDLRRLADAFEQSHERKEVKNKAKNCTLDINNYMQFSRILKGLFNPGGITHSRIIVLFFFCSDFAIRTLKECSRRFGEFIRWFFQFLADYIYEWVELNGGWFAVLNPKSYSKYILSTVVVCMVLVGVYKWMKR